VFVHVRKTRRRPTSRPTASRTAPADEQGLFDWADPPAAKDGAPRANSRSDGAAGKPWVLRWVPAGKTHETQITIGPMSMRHAEAARLALWLKLNGLADVEDPTALTWQAFTAKYLEAKADLARATVREIRSVLGLYTADQHPVLLADVTRGTVEEYRIHRLKSCASFTVRKELGTLSTAFSWAVGLGHLASNPAGGVKVGRLLKADTEAFTLTETETFLALLAKWPTWVQASLRLAVRWGLRCGELAALERADVDFRDRLVHVRIKVRAKNAWNPKSRRSRVVPLDEETAGILQELSHRDDPILWGPPSAPLKSADGKGGFKRTLRKEANAIYARMSLAPAKPLHFLRATALTNMRRRGVPAWIIRQIMGHTTDRIGDEHYDGIKGPEAAHTAAELMSSGPAVVQGKPASVTQA